MALDGGDCRMGTGLSALIAEKIKAECPEFDPAKDMGWLMPNAIAQAVVEYFKANAEIVTTVTTTTTGELDSPSVTSTYPPTPTPGSDIDGEVDDPSVSGTGSGSGTGTIT